MKFIVSSSTLVKQLQNLIGIINSNNTLPILDNFLFALEENELVITASDIETVMSARIEVQSEYQGKIAINARLLFDAIKTLPEQPLTFIINSDAHTLEITSDMGNYDMAFFDGDEFPEIKDIESSAGIEILAEILSKAIAKTVFATANDDLRPMMNGVLFQLSPENITFVATDAHKLVKYSRSDLHADNTAEFIVPKKPLNVLKNALSQSDDTVKVQYNETNAKFDFDNISLVCRLIEGKYPNYNSVIPKDNPNKLTINRVSFLTSVRRASVFSSKTNHQIRLKISGQVLEINAEDIDFSNKAEETLSCTYSGDDMQIGFNSKFLLEMLNNLESEDILLEMSVPSRAGILTPADGLEEGEEILMLVMPVMIK